MKKWQRNVKREVTQLKDVLTCYWRAALGVGSKGPREATESQPKLEITAARPEWSRLH